ncbi:hypothetical protein [uncultured Clostridium sp.]|uniref:hypothetical protein n=1 Tax=uncultured Clostridium sp. TaxID=59620 RepID=UPI0025DE827A|nr:hypothetical protein [uncultured Clostridium sp.]
MLNKYNISENDISWIINNEEISEDVIEKFLFLYEKNKLDLMVNNIEAQVLSAVNTVLKYIINDREKIDDILDYIYEKYYKE